MPRIEKKIRHLSPDNPLPVIDIEVNGQTFVALLDTGATINLTAVKPEGWVFSKRKKFSTFTGVTSKKFSDEEHTIEGLVAKGFVLVDHGYFPFDQGIDFVLGQSFFEKNGAVLDFKAKTFVAEVV